MGREGVQRAEIVATVPALGPVMFFDNCDGALLWDKSGTGSDYGVTKDASVVFMGDSSIKMVTRATTPSIGDSVRVQKDLYTTKSPRCTLDFVFRFEVVADCDTIMFGLVSDDSSITEAFSFVYDVHADEFQYYSASGVWTAIISSVGHLAPATWHRVSVEIDMTLKQIMYFTYNGVRSDKLELDGFESATGSVKKDYIFIQLIAKTDQEPVMYFDQVLLKEGGQ